MLVGNLKYFFNNGDFDMVMRWVNHAVSDPVSAVMNPFILVPLLISVGLMFSPKTTGMAQQMILYIPTLVFLGTTFVVLRNDSISDTGPFSMALVSFFIIIGWLIWTQLLSD